jgi:hypothetical protein
MEELERALEEALVVDTPQSLSAVANKLGPLDPKNLRDKFPDLSAHVVERFLQLLRGTLV